MTSENEQRPLLQDDDIQQSPQYNTVITRSFIDSSTKHDETLQLSAHKLVDDFIADFSTTLNNFLSEFKRSRWRGNTRAIAYQTHVDALLSNLAATKKSHSTLQI